MQPHDPQEDRLSKLAAIAQIYGALSGPQFRQEETARQDARDKQQQAFQMLQLMGLQRYQQQELAARQAALDGQNSRQDKELDLRGKEFEASQAARHDALTEHRADRQAAEDNDFARSTMALGDPRMTGYLNQAQMNRDTALPLSRQAAQYQHKGQVADAQSAWEGLAPAWDKLTPEQQDAQYAAMAQKYPALNSGEVDFSRGFAALPQTNAAPIVQSLDFNDPNMFANSPFAPLVNSIRGALGSTEMLPAPPPKTAEQLGAELIKNHPEWATRNFMTF